MDTIKHMTQLIERIGLAMTGLACGTFVAASVGHADIGILQSEWASLVIVVAGGIGFAAASGLQYRETRRSGLDPVCLLCAAGTFLTSVMALTSVGVLVIGADPPAVWLSLLAASWIGGVVLQIAAAGVARYGDNRPPRRSILVAPAQLRDAA
ncbi:hypothetical protein LRC39_20415 [Rhodopseudomonas sp. P1]|uniref:hypothetical protein n=1 Tax=Rhodopseudomonas sp. P1 TaxID=3434357 RepID=UPI0031FC4FC3